MNQNTTAPGRNFTGRNFTRFFPDFLTARQLLSAMLLSAALLAAIPPAAAAEGEIPKVNLNKGDLEALQYIPGIGPKRATDIIRVRTEKKGFKSIEDLREVSGIGEMLMVDIRQYGTLNGGVPKLNDEMRENPPAQSVMPHKDGKDDKDDKDDKDEKAAKHSDG